MGLANGLGVQETLLLEPGALLDLWEGYLDFHGVKRGQEDI